MKIYLRGGRAELACPRARAEPGHLVTSFVWTEGSEHVLHHHVELQCPCGQVMRHVGGDDPWAHPAIEVEGTPHGA